MRRRRHLPRGLCWVACLLFVFPPPAAPQVAAGANRIYRTPEGRQREAFEMDHPNRGLLEDTKRLVASFRIAPGDVVADIGAGVGYLLPYLVAAVGPQGRVIAEERFLLFTGRRSLPIHSSKRLAHRCPQDYVTPLIAAFLEVQSAPRWWLL